MDVTSVEGYEEWLVNSLRAMSVADEDHMKVKSRQIMSSAPECGGHMKQNQRSAMSPGEDVNETHRAAPKPGGIKKKKRAAPKPTGVKKQKGSKPHRVQK